MNIHEYLKNKIIRELSKQVQVGENLAHKKNAIQND
jgi:hypothetical protein